MSPGPRPIVVVEDDPMIRESLQEFLELEGYRVQVAENGRIGLELIRQLGGECMVLLDLQMPEMTGEEMLDALARERTSAVRDVPVLVLSARAEGLRHERILGFLRKPIDLDQLLRWIVEKAGAPAAP